MFRFVRFAHSAMLCKHIARIHFFAAQEKGRSWHPASFFSVLHASVTTRKSSPRVPNADSATLTAVSRAARSVLAGPDTST